MISREKYTNKNPIRGARSAPRMGFLLEEITLFHDGGLILKFNNRYVGLFLRFQSQWLPTNDQTGNRIPNVSQSIPAGTSTPNEPDEGDTQPDISSPDIYIERALVNPIGDDTRQEVVVLGNLTTISSGLNQLA